MLKFPMMSNFTSAQRKAMGSFGLLVSLCWALATTAAAQAREKGCWLQHGWEGRTGCLELVVLGEKKCPDEPYSTMYPTCLAQPASKLCRTRGLLRLERSLQTTRSHHRLTPPHPKPECCADTALKHCSRDRTPYFGGKNSF